MDDEEIIPHMFHEHPLSLIPNLAAETCYSWNNWCYGCFRFFLPGEAAYGCSQKCGFRDLFHKDCMEMPREIRHHLHPSHSLTLTFTLTQEHDSPYIFIRSCAVCEGVMRGMYYECSGGCDWWIHLGCAGGFDEVVVDDNPTMKHPSHPQHHLKFSKKAILCCDACGATHKGKSYICTVCDYWIHESCALLPVSAHFPHHRPDHSLSLAFHIPYQYILYKLVCAICSGALPLRRWVYHCHLCNYVVHTNCAFRSPSNSSNNENAVDDEKDDITKGPIDDIYGEIIIPFVKREREQITIPQKTCDKYKFPNHPHHLLSFTIFSSSPSSSSSHHHNHEKEEGDDDDDDDDDEDSSISRSELTCDGCTLPIHEKKQRDDDEYENGYMSCDECKYFLHLSCFNLPPHLSSLPLHPIQNHGLTLLNAGKLTCWALCSICRGYTNGLFYKCTQCYFTIDIKCASLPNTIKHAAHPQHYHLMNLVMDNHWHNFCGVCYGSIYPENVLYRCNSCKFCICGECVLLPAQNKHRLEKHSLRLTYDAYVNRPGEFYCSSCEGQMNPRRRMYHCRDCDQSFHPECIPARSGQYRNIKYGMQQYVIPTLHDHPLRFQIITKKKLCDLCHQDKYQMPGFQCASCTFVICLNFCAEDLIDKIHIAE